MSARDIYALWSADALEARCREIEGASEQMRDVLRERMSPWPWPKTPSLMAQVWAKDIEALMNSPLAFARLLGHP